jgi:hypothetical protein
VPPRGRVERDHIRPFGLTGNDGLVGDSFVCIARTGSGYPAAFQVTVSRENDTTPYFSPEYTPVKPSGCAAACCSVQVSLPIEDKIAIRIPAVAACSCETK